MKMIEAELELLMAYLKHREGKAKRAPVLLPYGTRRVIAIMPCGTVGYVLQKDKTALNLASFSTIEAPEVQKQIGKGEELRNTGLLREWKKTNVFIYESIYGSVGIDPRLLRNFAKDAKFYHREQHGVITVTEDDKVVGVVYPVRFPQLDQN